MMTREADKKREQVKAEIDKDREKKEKKPLKDKDNDPKDGSGSEGERTVKTSTTDPESGWFHKGDHMKKMASQNMKV